VWPGLMTILAVPSMMTGSPASSVVTTQRGSAVRFWALREAALVVNHSVLSSHMPQTGMECGRPSGQTDTTQKLRALVSRSAAHDHGRSPLPSSGPAIP